MSAQLQPELWAHVLSFLKRPAPKAYERATWKDLHQQDLVTASQVSSTFHELAIPHLYSKAIIVDRLPRLLLHTTDAPATLESKITPKLDRLKLVRDLRLCSMGPRKHLEWSVIDLLERGDFAAVSESESKRNQRMIDEGMSECIGLADLLSATPWHDLPRLQLDRLTIGQAGNTSWHALVDSADYTHILFNHINHPYQEYVLHLGARYICVYDGLGPYSLVCGRLPPHVPRPTINAHHWANQRFAPLVPGAKIRHLFERAKEIIDPLRLEEMPCDKHLGLLEETMWSASDHAPADALASIPQTEIELYGLFASGAGRDEVSSESSDESRSEHSHLDSHATEETVGSEDLSGENEGREEEEMLEVDLDDIGEDGIADLLLRSGWTSTLPAAWEKTVKFRRWAQTPDCEACGWDPKQHRLDWAEEDGGRILCLCGHCE